MQEFKSLKWWACLIIVSSLSYLYSTVWSVGRASWSYMDHGLSNAVSFLYWRDNGYSSKEKERVVFWSGPSALKPFEIRDKDLKTKNHINGIPSAPLHTFWQYLWLQEAQSVILIIVNFAIRLPVAFTTLVRGKKKKGDKIFLNSYPQVGSDKHPWMHLSAATYLVIISYTPAGLLL